MKNYVTIYNEQQNIEIDSIGKPVLFVYRNVLKIEGQSLPYVEMGRRGEGDVMNNEQKMTYLKYILYFQTMRDILINKT